MEVTFSMSKETLTVIRAAFETGLVEATAVVNDIKANIARIDAALNPVRRQVIPSETYSERDYTVTATSVDGFGPSAVTYECECPSFQYNRGLDISSRCKHIRRAIERNAWT